MHDVAGQQRQPGLSFGRKASKTRQWNARGQADALPVIIARDVEVEGAFKKAGSTGALRIRSST
jgi:hypothetical protein